MSELPPAFADTKSIHEIDTPFISVETLHFPTPASLPLSRSINSASRLQQQTSRLSSLFQTRFSSPVHFPPHTHGIRTPSPRASSELKHGCYRPTPSKDWKTPIMRGLPPKTCRPSQPTPFPRHSRRFWGQTSASAGASRPLAANRRPCTATGAPAAPGDGSNPTKKLRYAANNQLRGGTTLLLHLNNHK